MTLLSLQTHRAHAFDDQERDTSGFLISLQLGPLVMEWWLTVRTRGKGRITNQKGEGK